MSTTSPKVKLNTNSNEFIILTILSKVGEIAVKTFFLESYSYSKIYRELFEINENAIDKLKSRQKISKTINRLKNKGFIVKTNDLNITKWKMTKLGKTIYMKTIHNMPLKPDGKKRLIIFDIPEKYKKHRDWLRETLILNGYKLLQKSVWIGNRPLRDFILNEIKNRKIFNCIHFFEIKEIGTLMDADI